MRDGEPFRLRVWAEQNCKANDRNNSYAGHQAKSFRARRNTTQICVGRGACDRGREGAHFQAGGNVSALRGVATKYGLVF